MAIDKSGNVYITGTIGGGTHGWQSWLRDYGTFKYNSDGVLQWMARYNGSGDSEDVATSLTLDANDNVYVTGYSVGSGSSYDYATIKYTPDGAQQWVARYNGTGNGADVPTLIAADASGNNVYVTGYSTGSGTGFDYATIKYTSNSEQQWTARYNGLGNNTDIATAMVYDTNGNVYVTGYSIGSGTGYDYTTIKYSSFGLEQWIARYNGGGTGADIANSIALDAGGNVYVTGYSYGGSAQPDYATLKYSQSEAIDVTIDIKPETSPNRINPNNNGVIPVAILSSSTFDATAIDPLSVKFGPRAIEVGATEVHNMGHIEDVDGDGIVDLLMHFATNETDINTFMSLTGRTFSEQCINGSDSIVIIGGGKE